MTKKYKRHAKRNRRRKIKKKKKIKKMKYLNPNPSKRIKKNYNNFLEERSTGVVKCKYAIRIDPDPARRFNRSNISLYVSCLLFKKNCVFLTHLNNRNLSV